MIFWLAEQQWLVRAAEDVDRLLNKNVGSPSALIYVTGVPRSRTTFLAQKIAEGSSASSFTYGHFPLLSAPNLWPIISKWYYGSGSYTERPHKDGLLVGKESVDSFDEIVWQTKGLSTAKRNPEIQITKDVISRYLNVIERFLGSADSKIYVAKNNAIMFRATQICDFLPQAKFLIVLRHPGGVVPSLIRNHELFSTYIEGNADYRRRMHLLCHSEFGPDVSYPIADENVDDELSELKQAQDWQSYYSKVFTEYIRMFSDASKSEKADQFFFLESDESSVEKIESLQRQLGVNFNLSGFSQSKYSYSVPDNPYYREATAVYEEFLAELNS